MSGRSRGCAPAWGLLGGQRAGGWASGSAQRREQWACASPAFGNDAPCPLTLFCHSLRGGLWRQVRRHVPAPDVRLVRRARGGRIRSAAAARAHAPPPAAASRASLTRFSAPRPRAAPRTRLRPTPRLSNARLRRARALSPRAARRSATCPGDTFSNGTFPGDDKIMNCTACPSGERAFVSWAPRHERRACGGLVAVPPAVPPGLAAARAGCEPGRLLPQRPAAGPARASSRVQAACVCAWAGLVAWRPLSAWPQPRGRSNERSSWLGETILTHAHRATVTDPNAALLTSAQARPRLAPRVQTAAPPACQVGTARARAC